jgi:hypothetical protein
MIEPCSESGLRLVDYYWTELQGLRDRLSFAGHPAPVDLLDGLVELRVEPPLTEAEIAERFGAVAVLVGENLARLDVMGDVFSPFDRQKAFRLAIDLLRTEAALG